MYDLDEILIQSVKVRASDIHLTTGRPPSYRIDGVLAPIEGERLTPQMLEDILMPLMDVRHREELQNNGQTDFAYAISGVGRFRVNVFKQRGTLASVMRSLPFNIPEPEELGIPAEVVEMTTRKRGLILVTGPTGSGKSTTLASLIHVINRNYPYHIITLEDPIEYLHRHDKSVVNQREIGSDSTNYAQALRAALREDPDVILVGEMRDLETISTAGGNRSSGIFHPSYYRCGQDYRQNHRCIPAKSAAADKDPACLCIRVRCIPAASQESRRKRPCSCT